MAVLETGSDTAGVANVDSGFNLSVALPVSDVPRIGSIRSFSENDTGTYTGAAQLMSGETDLDFRQRMAVDTSTDGEVFNYAAQNTGKTPYWQTTMANTWTVNGLVTNSASITTINTGTSVKSYQTYSILGTQTTAVDFEFAFSAINITNTTQDIGFYQSPVTFPYAPTDGVYLRDTSAGLQLVSNYNGVETASAVSTFIPTINKKYQYILYISQRYTELWVNDGTGPENTFMIAELSTPAGQGAPFMSASLPFGIRHVIGASAASGVQQITLFSYSVRNGGFMVADQNSTIGNRMFGSYQGLSGGTMGSLATYPNSSNPTAAAPSNTALTANLPSGLGGQGAVTAAAAAATDGIWAQYLNPAGTVNVQGRRLRITGVRVDAINMGATVATTATTVQFSLAFNGTNTSLATAEGAAARAHRRIALGFMNWPIGALIGARPDNGPIFVDLRNSEIFVDPGSYLSLAGKFVNGTATASQVINFTWTPTFGWE
jgi:hypothetical protein